MAMGVCLRCIAQSTGLITRSHGHLYVSLVSNSRLTPGGIGAKEFDIGVGGGGGVAAGAGAGGATTGAGNGAATGTDCGMGT